jgi:hypothetical protein
MNRFNKYRRLNMEEKALEEELLFNYVTDESGISNSQISHSVDNPNTSNQCTIIMPDELVGESSSYSNVPRNEDEHYNSCVNEDLDIEMLSNELENEPQTDEEVDIFLSENFFVEEELTIENLESQLYRCQIEEAISKNAMNKILQIFAPYVQGLPTTFTTIENHVRPTNNIVPIATQVNGDFIWLGIKEPLKRVINTGIQPPDITSLHYENLLSQASDLGQLLVSLQISVDGIPLFSSSNKALWPIVVNVNESISKSTFLAGAFYGVSKPKDLENFLSPLCDELTDLVSNGLFVGFQNYCIRVFSFVCDAPARSFLKGTKQCNGYHSCDFCQVKGCRYDKKIIFCDIDCDKRTDSDFLQFTNDGHHKYASPLRSIPSIGLVTNFPPEAMHLCYLGVCKRFLTFWIEKVLRPSQRACLSEKVMAFGQQLPIEFKRKVRSLHHFKYWKATELRNFMLYISPFVLDGFLPTDMVKHFMLLHFGLYTLSTENSVDLLDNAHACILKFVAEVPDVYSYGEMVYNTHVLIHLVDYVKLLGPLDYWAAFKFESFLYFLKRRIKRSSGIMEQVRKLSLALDSMANVKSTDVIIKLTLDFPNNFALTNKGIVKLTSIRGNIASGYLCLIQETIKAYPYPSSVHNIGTYRVTDTLVTGTVLKKCVVYQLSDCLF